MNVIEKVLKAVAACPNCQCCRTKIFQPDTAATVKNAGEKTQKPGNSS